MQCAGLNCTYVHLVESDRHVTAPQYLGAPLAAEESYRAGLDLAAGEQLSPASSYLLPYTTVELALLLVDTQQDTQQAARLLDQAKNGYKDYSLQSRLHFRIHAAQKKLAGEEGGTGEGSELLPAPTKQEGESEERRGSLVRELEQCSESELRELVPHI